MFVGMLLRDSARDFKGPFTQAIFVAATRCNFCRAKVASSFKHVRNPCDIAATNRTKNRTWFTRANFEVATLARKKLHRVAATKIACVNGPLKSRAESRSNNHSSAIADHMTQTGHKIKWDHFDILATGQSDLHCKIKETLLIRDLKPALNENVTLDARGLLARQRQGTLE